MPRRRGDKEKVDIEELLSQVDILEVAQRYTDLRMVAGRHIGLCPFHSEKTPSFQVFDDEGDQHYHCYGCGAHGSALKMVMEAEGVEAGKAIEILKGDVEGRRGMPVERRQRRASPPVPRPILPVPVAATPLFAEGGERGSKGPHVTQPVRIRNKELGDWSPGEDGKPLRRQFQPAMVHDYRDKAGSLLGYVLRMEWVRDGKKKKSPVPVTWCSFEDGSEGWASIGFDDPKPIYGADLLGEVEDGQGARTCVLVEGEKAADAGNRLFAGRYPFVSPLGGTKNFRHADISVFAGWRVITMPDNDLVGREAMEEIALRLLAENDRSGLDVLSSIEVFEVDVPASLPEGWDIADAEGDPEFLMERLEAMIAGAMQVAAAAPVDDELAAALAEHGGAPGDRDLSSEATEIVAKAGPPDEEPAAKVLPFRRNADAAPEDDPAGFDFEAYIKSCEEDPKAAFAPEALQALNDLKERDLGRYHMVKGSLRGAKVPIRDLDDALKTSAEAAKRLAAERLLNGGGLGTGSIDLRPLGFDKGNYFYYSTVTQQIVVLKPGQHRSHDLFQLAPVQFWEARYPGGRNGIAWEAAASDLMQRCHAQKIFDADKVRGLGAWIEEAGRGSAVVMHTGDKLIVDGQAMGLADHESPYVYERGKPLRIGDLDDPLSADEATVLLEICGRLRWERTPKGDKPATGALLAGWIALAPICGALEYRPHCWVTAQAGAGKTWIMTNIVQRLLESTALYCQSTSTEAGIRAALGIDARPILFDEAESNDAEARVRMQRVLELMRSATAESGAPIRKSDKDQKQRVFLIRSMAMLSSISVTIQQQADMSRIIVMNLAPPPRKDDEEKVRADTANFEEIERLVRENLTHEFSVRLLARMVKMAPIVRKNARTLSRAAAAIFGNQRLGDMIGTLMAGAYALDSDDAISEEEAKGFLRTYSWSEYIHEEATNDEMRCLSMILNREHRIELGGAANRTVTRTAAELVVDALRAQQGKNSWAVNNDAETPVPPQVAQTQLMRLGIKINLADRMLMISNTHPKIAETLQNSAWSHGWLRMLKRVPGARSSSKPAYFGASCSSQYVEIPIRQAVEIEVEVFDRAGQGTFAAAS